MAYEKFEMKKIPEGHKRGWEVELNGNIVEDVNNLKISSKFGTFEYGMRPEGYDGLTIYEPGGGCAVTILYSFDENDELIIGLLLEKRMNIWDYYTPCIVGGYVDIGESHEEAQAREAMEETGLDTTKAVLLSGLPSNINRALYVANPFEKEGVTAYGLKIPFSDLFQFNADDPDNRIWRLRPGLISKNFKNPDAVYFCPWRVAIRETPDGIARAAIAQLLADVL